MGRRIADAGAGQMLAEPTLVTRWEDFFVDGGVLFVRFWCGSTPYCIAMGPSMAFDAIDRARKALQRGVVERLLGDGAPGQH